MQKKQHVITHTIEEKTYAALVRLLYIQAKGAIYGSLFTAVCIVIGLYNYVSNRQLLSWFMLLVITSLIRVIVVNTYFRLEPAIEMTYRWHKIFLAITVASGVAWMLVCVFIMPGNSVNEILITLAVAGISAGSVPYFAASRIVSSAFVLLILPFFSFRMFFEPDKTHHLVGILTIVYLVVLLVSAYRIHHEIYAALKFKFENDDLINRLSFSKDDIEVINKELQAEIVERKDVERLLRVSEEQYRLVTNALPVLIAYIDTEFKFQFNNLAYESWFHKSLDQITGRPVKDIIGETAYTTFVDHYSKLILGEQVIYETAMYFHEDQERFVSVNLIPHISNGTLQGIFSLISDATPRINFLATHDVLTNLPNRSLFAARMAHALRQASKNHSKLALLFLDLDHFKNVNDSLGHEIGDLLLVKVVERLNTCVDENDTIARLGGDEFIILLHFDNDINRPQKVADKICCVLSNVFKVAEREIYITTSVGISIFPDDGDNMGLLLKNADMAMYRAKEHGRNTYEFYTHGMNEIMQKKLSIETNLRSALERDEFKLYYQPLLDIQYNKIIGLEALLRWYHPHLGIISPLDFIPVAEESGLIVPIGDWVLRSVCQQYFALKESGYADLCLSVNISAKQFIKKDLVDIIKNILMETGLPGKYLNIELTESLIMKDVAYSMKMVRALKEFDITISIDDFGTGYSSLSYLKKFPFDIIKIDRSFITDFTIHHEDAAIVGAIITLAHNLKMRVTAEGVETQAQFNFLKEHGCDVIQGFLIFPPVPINELSSILQRNALIVQ